MSKKDDETIISDGLISIRNGILAGDWDKICHGYNSISGEQLEPPTKPEPKLSKLETIRKNLENSKNDPVEKVETVSAQDLSVKEIKEKLSELGVPSDDLKNLKKPELQSLLDELDRYKISKEENDIALQEFQQKGSKQRIIGDGFNKIEALKNRAIRQQHPRPVIKRDTTIRTKVEGDIGYNFDNPERPSTCPPRI